MKILIADDDLTCRLLLSEVLKSCGHEVIEAEDGAQAWSLLEKDDAPQMAILDWMMPEIEGPELIRRICSRQTSEPPYLILLTTKARKSDLVAGLNSGANDYLSKPFDLAELRARVEVGRRVIEIQERLAKQVLELRRALEHIKTLQGILPICSYCKKIRDDDGYWNQVEAYITEHSEVQFSHGICPQCLAGQLELFEGSRRPAVSRRSG